jgi:5-methylcytosine-specific restriction endonuclease McrA
MAVHIDHVPYKDPEKRKAYARERYRKDPSRSRRYYEENRERIIAAVGERQAARKEEKRAYDRERYLANKQKVRDQNAAWEARNPEKVRARTRFKNHRRRGATPDEAAQDYMHILQVDPCSYCGGPMEHVDHIDPISRGGTGDWSNLTAACQSCNYSKNDRPLLLALLGFH